MDYTESAYKISRVMWQFPVACAHLGAWNATELNELPSQFPAIRPKTLPKY